MTYYLNGPLPLYARLAHRHRLPRARLASPPPPRCCPCWPRPSAVSCRCCRCQDANLSWMTFRPRWPDRHWTRPQIRMGLQSTESKSVKLIDPLNVNLLLQACQTCGLLLVLCDTMLQFKFFVFFCF